MRVSGVATLLQVPAEQVIFTEGQAGETMYAVIAGSVRLAQDGAKVAELGAGQHFGEMSLVDRSVRSLTAVASQDTQLIAIARADFYRCVAVHAGQSVRFARRAIVAGLDASPALLVGDRVVFGGPVDAHGLAELLADAAAPGLLARVSEAASAR